MPQVDDQTLSVDHVDAWSVWLEQHHAQSVCVWLKIRRVRRQGSGILLDEAVNEALRWGWIDGLMHPEDRDGFWLRFSPRKPHSVWSLSNYRRMQVHLKNHALTPAGLRTVEWAKQYGSWSTFETAKITEEHDTESEAPINPKTK